MTTRMQSDEQRVKEVWPDAEIDIYDLDGRFGYRVAIKSFVSADDCGTINKAWADAASRLPKAEAAVSGKRNDCEGCGEPVYLTRGYGYSHVDTTLNEGCDARPQASHESVPKAVPPTEEGEAARWLRNSVTWDAIRRNESGATVQAVASLVEAAWNAAKASSPVVAGGEREKEHWWFTEIRPIINAIGEISVQEAMDAVEKMLKEPR